MVQKFFKKIRDSLTKTRDELLGALNNILPFGIEINDEVLERVEEVLYEADLGIHAAERIVSVLRDRAGEINRNELDPFAVMKETIVGIFREAGESERISFGGDSPYVLLIIGVNGVGKTTTIGKLAHRFKNEGHSVLLAACDTFRTAAVEQLEIWANRAGAEIIKAPDGADAASVAYDALMRAKARSNDVVIIDTAGRLHTSRNLMEELKKIRKVISNAVENAPHETLLVLDASTGQNALVQAETFNRELSVTGIVLTKLDGTAKGGIVVSIIDRLGIPVKLIGTGEGIEDLRDFDTTVYTDALLAVNEQN